VGVAATPDGSDHVRECPAFPQGLQHIVTGRQVCDVTTVAMESTGIDGVPRYERLESAGFEVLLVDPSDTTPVTGRPKTARRDCQWLQRLPAHGLLAAAVRPDEQTWVLRRDLRLRANHVRSAGPPIQHRQNALAQMHRTLPAVVSDLTGVTGMGRITAILRGAHAPVQLAQYRERHGKNRAATSAQALNGSDRAEPRCALQHAVDCGEFYQPKIGERDLVIPNHLHPLKQEPPLPPLPSKPRGRKRQPNEPRFDVRPALYDVTGVDLTESAGIDDLTALTVRSEIGTAMTRWATVKHVGSWLGRWPQHKKSGGKIKSSRTRPGMTRAAAALALAASRLHRHKNALGAYFRRLKSRLGTPKAITATAPKLARMVYHTLRSGQAYVPKTQEQYDALMRSRQLAARKRKARMLGLEVIAHLPPPQVAPADNAPGTRHDHLTSRRGMRCPPVAHSRRSP
jgi:transposase